MSKQHRGYEHFQNEQNNIFALQIKSIEFEYSELKILATIS